MALQGSTGVIGVDGLPVVMVRRLDAPGTALAERQLSYNCPRYITVRTKYIRVLHWPPLFLHISIFCVKNA